VLSFLTGAGAGFNWCWCCLFNWRWCFSFNWALGVVFFNWRLVLFTTFWQFGLLQILDGYLDSLIEELTEP